MNVAFVLVLYGLVIRRSNSLSCLDFNNNEVDWYTTYKVPIISQSNISMVREGSAHFYLDQHNVQWMLSKIPISETGQAISNTLEQIYNAQEKTILHIMYNDERAISNITNNHLGGGHTKGVVAFDMDGGFWLVHSVPKFPAPKSGENGKQGYVYPSNGFKEGQSFLCISFPYKQLNQIATQLQYNQPDIYDKYIPPIMYQNFPVLNNLDKTVKGPPWANVIKLVSQAGQPFISFAKSKQFSKDLYADLIAPYLKTSLFVESWQNGEGKLPSDCSIPYKVYNVKGITLPEGVVFKETKDHSKWAIAFFNSTTLSFTSEEVVNMGQQTNFWTCIGDINRQQHQKDRGGGSVCLNNEQVWRSYSNSVTKYEHCY